MQARLDHEKLDVYQLLLRFVTWVTCLTHEVKRNSKGNTGEVCSQLDRASLSALLNTAEGNGKRRRRTRARFFDDARGSSTECAACLDALVAKGMSTSERIAEGKEMLVRIVSMLTKLVQRYSDVYTARESTEEYETTRSFENADDDEDEEDSTVRPNLPYQDHYELARDAAIERLRQPFDPERLTRLGAELRQDGAIELPALCWRFAMRLEPFSTVLLPGDEQVSIVWQILALDYLGGEPADAPARFLSFAEFPHLRSYLSAFEGRVTGRLSRGVGAHEETFVRAAERCQGARGSGSPLSYLFRLFPAFQLQVVRHEGDEDFPPSCNVLFPDNALSVLSAESVIVAAERLVSSLEGKSPSE